MKHCSFLVALFLFLSVATSQILAADPVVIEIVTDHQTEQEALVAAKMALLQEKFVLQGAIQDHSFTAKRSTGSEADFYIADVMSSNKNGRVSLTITFVKMGTGFLKLQTVADTISEKLRADINPTAFY